MPAGATLKRRSRAVPWRPILTGHRARLARQVIVNVVRAADAGDDPSLLSGWAGLALLHGYASRAGLAPADTGVTSDHLDHALDLLPPAHLTPWLGGFAGVAWTAAHLERQGMGFLDGSSGVALALLAAVSPIEPAWDRCLFLSARSR